MASIDDLVKVSGFSRSTVFRYLAGKQVRSAAREAIIAAMRETGFAPIEKSREEFAILVSVPPDFQGFRGYADTVEGIMRRGAATGVPVFFQESLVTGRRFAAIILGKNLNDEDAERKARAAAGIPCVLVNRIIQEDAASWVSVDFRAAAYDAAARLAAAGRSKIACWIDPENRRVELAKAEGLRRFSAEMGTRLVLLGPADGEPEAAARDVLSSPERPDAWFAPSDELAMRIIRTASSLGLRVPEDLSVIGMNDVSGAAYFSPAITSVHVPFHECGAAAVDAVITLLERPLERSVKILLKHRIVERESIDPVAIRNQGF